MSPLVYWIGSLLLAASAPSSILQQAGPHPVGWLDVTIPDPSGGTIDGRLYYPAVASGEGEAADPTAGPFPLVGLLHRFVGEPSDYDDLSNHVASWGFFIASIGTETGANARMQREAQDTADLLNWVAAQSDDGASPYSGMVAPGPWGAIGHSMGGGALFYLIEDEPNVRVLVGMQPYRGAALGGFANSADNVREFTGALLQIGGGVDGTAPPQTHSRRYFTRAHAAARNVHTIVPGLGHQGPTDDPPTNEPLPASDQNALHRLLATAFLRAELLGEEGLYRDLIEAGAGSSWDWESRSGQPAIWLEPVRHLLQDGAVVRARVDLGIVADQVDQLIVVAGLTPAAIATDFGMLEIDPSDAIVVTTATLGDDGMGRLELPIPLSLVGAPVFYQVFAAGPDRATLTRASVAVAGFLSTPSAEQSQRQ